MQKKNQILLLTLGLALIVASFVASVPPTQTVYDGDLFTVNVGGSTFATGQFVRGVDSSFNGKQMYTPQCNEWLSESEALCRQTYSVELKTGGRGNSPDARFDFIGSSVKNVAYFLGVNTSKSFLVPRLSCVSDGLDVNGTPATVCGTVYDNVSGWEIVWNPVNFSSFDFPPKSKQLIQVRGVLQKGREVDVQLVIRNAALSKWADWTANSLSHWISHNESTGSYLNNSYNASNFTVTNGFWNATKLPNTNSTNNSMQYNGVNASSITTDYDLVNFFSHNVAGSIQTWLWDDGADAAGSFEYYGPWWRSQADSMWHGLVQNEGNGSVTQWYLTTGNSTQGASSLFCPTLSNNSWQQVVLTWNASVPSIKMYVNGTLCDSRSATFNYVGTSATIADVRVSRPGSSTYFSGRHTDWRFWGQELNASQVSNLYTIGYQDAPPTVWWNTTWNSKLPVNVSVASGSTNNSYIVGPINVSFQSGMAVDFSDVRFTNQSEDTLLNFWRGVAYNSSYAEFYVKIDQNITTSNYTTFLYYNAPGQSDASNFYATFPFGDDFNGGTLNTTIWNQTLTGSATSSVGGGFLVSTSGTTASSAVELNASNFYTIAGLTQSGMSLEARFNYSSFGASAPEWKPMGLWYDNLSSDVISLRHEWTDAAATFKVHNVNKTTVYKSGTFNSGQTTLTRYSLKSDTASVSAWMNGVNQVNITDSTKIPSNLALGPFIYGSATSGSPPHVSIVAYWDYIFARPYYSPEPTYGFSAVQNRVNASPSDIVFVSPTLANNSNSSTNYFYVNATGADASPNTCTLSLFNTANGSATNYTMTKTTNTTHAVCEKNVTNLYDGLFNYTVYLNNTAALSNNSVTRTIRLDATKPIISLTAPANGSVVFNQNVVYLNGTYTESNFANITTNDSHWSATYTGSSPFSLTNTSTIANGNYTVKVSAFDTSGNTAFDTVTFTMLSETLTIDFITAKGAEDPNTTSTCDNTTLGAFYFNVTDTAGRANINNAASYAQISNGAVSNKSLTCTDNGGSGNTMQLKCSGNILRYFDTSGFWNVTYYVQGSQSIVNATNSSTTFTFNSATLLGLPLGSNIGFGTAYASTTANANNTNFSLQNCGNVNVNSSITGANLTSGSANFTVNNFGVSSNATYSSRLVLSTSAQDYSKQPSGLPKSTAGENQTWPLWFYMDVPGGISALNYSGSWTFTASAS